MSEYGLSGSATYAVQLSGLDEIMQNLPDNLLNQISARDVRDVVYTLWLNMSMAGLSFSYTQTAPLNEVSTSAVGGISSGKTFSNVQLQQLLDSMFFPPLDNIYTITGGGSFLLGNTTSTTNVSVTLTQRNDKSLTNAYVKRTSSRGVSWAPNGTDFTPYPTLPASKGQTTTKNYTGELPDTNFTTTYTLTVFENSIQLLNKSVSVIWFANRYYGTVDFNSTYPDLDLSSDYAINTIGYTTLRSFLPFTGPSKISNLGNTIKSSSQLSSVTFTNPNAQHIWFAWPVTDYGGDGIPTKFIFNLNQVNIFTNLTTATLSNENGYEQQYRLYVSNKKQAPNITINIEN